MVLIDIENVVGGGVSMPSEVHIAQAAITSAIGRRSDDHVVLACGLFDAAVVGFEWDGPHRLVFRSGDDGADLELLEILDGERLEERFKEIVLVSGDRIFTNSVSRLCAAGVGVTVASRPEACSRELRMAAARTSYIEHATAPIKEAA